MALSKEFFSIGEIAKIFNMPVKTIRYYDEIGLLKPAYVDSGTNYRYYSVDQFVLIDIIRNSKQMGMPLKEIQQSVEGELKVEDIANLIDRQLDYMSAKIDDLLKARNSMEEIRNLVLETLKVEHNKVFITEEVRQPFLRYPFVSHTIEEQEINFRRALSLGDGEKEVYAIFGVSTVAQSYFEKGIFLHPDIRHYVRNESPGIQYDELPAGKYACIVFDDNSFSKAKYYRMLAEYLNQNDIKPQGDFIEQWIIPRVEEKRESTLVKLKIKIDG